MMGSQIELNYRVSILFGPQEFIQVINLAIETIGFDDEAQFDLVIHKINDERLLLEVMPLDVGSYIQPQLWPSIHQILFSNHWIKGMNCKIQLVKRHDYINIAFKCDIENVERRTQFVNKLEELLAKEMRAEAGDSATEQDRERLFGSMLMTEAVIQVTRKAFLSGDFRQALAAATKLLTSQAEGLLKKKIKEPADILTYLTQEPPRVIFPDLSGKQLHNELLGLGNLSVGVLTIAKPIIQGKQAAPEDPARVLKCLVLIGMIIERMQSASPNPATSGEQRPAKPAAKPVKKAARQKKAAKPVKKKSAGKKATTTKKSKVKPKAKPKAKAKVTPKAKLKVKLKKKVVPKQKKKAVRSK